MKVHHRQIWSMGTRLDLVVAGVDERLCDAILKDLKAEVERIEGMISIYRPDSVISLLNSMAHAGFIELESELFAIFREIEQLHRETGGYFDITLKPVSDFYRDHETTGIPVTPKIRERVGMDKLVVEGGGIRYSVKGVTIDLGGYGKGYAVQRVLPILESYRLEHALISFGESLVYGWGTHPYGDTWKVSVPVEAGADPVCFELKNEVLSTSGNSLNNQKKFANLGHIVNPITLQMATRQGLVHVKSKDPIRSEVFSTALFSAGPEQSREIIQNAAALEVCWLLPDS